jgi:phospholipid/cholesterol/gamma-HCH transport system permease protein
MHWTSLRRIPGSDVVDWLSPVGTSLRLIPNMFTPSAFKALTLDELRKHCLWMGLQSFHFVSLSAAIVSICLTIQCVVELQKYQAQDLAGAVISIGLLREIGPLTISMAWCAMVAARVSEDAKRYYLRYQSDSNFASDFVLPRYVAAIAMSIPLSAYGLLFGFITGALFAPLIGVNSTTDFLSSAREAIHDKDIAVYFIKLAFVNPSVAIFAGSVAGMRAKDIHQSVSADAVSATFLTCFALNLAVTTAAYLTGEPTL